MVRFQRRISIGPGLRLNLSKSGFGLSMGIKGVSLSTGPRGQSLNLGLPGTGLSHRIQLSGNKKQTPSAQLDDNKTRTLPSESMKYDFTNFWMFIDDNETIQVRKLDGQQFDDDELQKIKRTERYKEEFKSLNLVLYNKIEHKGQRFIEIYKYTPAIKTENEWKKEIEEISVQLNVKEYSESKPTEESCRKELMEQAHEKINSLSFLTNTLKPDEYVNNNFETYFKEEISNWEKRKKSFELSEIERIKQLEQKKEEILSKIIPGEKNYVNEAISNIVKDFIFPKDFSLDYEYSDDGKLFVDLDLPEIENLPHEKAKILTTGKISLKDKTQKELNEEYATGVCGLAFFFAGYFFNISPKISQIVISGYTQRIDKTTGNQNDEYVYSVKFNRKLFEDLSIKNIDPIAALTNFENKLDIKSNFDMKKIIPFI